MSLIKLPLHFEESLGEKTIYTLFDSGTTYSCINPDLVKGLANTEKLFRPMEVDTAALGN